MQDNLPLFESELDEVILHFPQLKKVVGSEGCYLKGVLDIPNDDGQIIASFMIEIHVSEKFPFAFPTLFEIGGDIPNDADWHKYENGSCCITVPPDEMLICKNGITVLEFVRKHGIAFFANHKHRILTGKYKNGDYAHGFDGLRQYYESLFKTSDMTLWAEYFDQTFNGKKIISKRNDQCFCGSGVKFKNCHDKVFQSLRGIGKKTAFQHILILLHKL